MDFGMCFGFLNFLTLGMLKLMDSARGMCSDFQVSKFRNLWNVRLRTCLHLGCLDLWILQMGCFQKFEFWFVWRILEFFRSFWRFLKVSEGFWIFWSFILKKQMLFVFMLFIYFVFVFCCFSGSFMSLSPLSHHSLITHPSLNNHAITTHSSLTHSSSFMFCNFVLNFVFIFMFILF